MTPAFSGLLQMDGGQARKAARFAEALHGESRAWVFLALGRNAIVPGHVVEFEAGDKHAGEIENRGKLRLGINLPRLHGAAVAVGGVEHAGECRLPACPSE